MNPFDLQGTQVTNMTPGGMPPGANVPPMAPGVMSGALNIQNQRRMEEMQALQKQASMMALWEQLQKQHEYQKNQGWRDAERDAGTVKATHTAQNYGRERDAEISTKETQAEVAKKTKDTNIASTNAGNIQKVSESAIKRMENFASELDTMEFNPMTGAADFDAMAERHGIPPNHPIRAKMRGAQTPEAFQMGVKQLRQKLLQSLEHQRAVALQTIKDEADYKRQTDSAKIGAGATIRAAELRNAGDHSNNVRNPANAAARAEALLSGIPDNLDVSTLKPMEQHEINAAVQVYDRVLMDKIVAITQTIAKHRNDLLAAAGGKLAADQEKNLQKDQREQMSRLIQATPSYYKRARQAELEKLISGVGGEQEGGRKRTLESFRQQGQN